MEKWKFAGLIVALVCILMLAPVAACDSYITKTGPSDVCTNGEITYAIKVFYEGNAGYYLNVSDTLPANVTFKSATDGGVNSAGTVKWTLKGPALYVNPNPLSDHNRWWDKTVYVTVTVKPNKDIIPQNKAKVRYYHNSNDIGQWREATVATKTNVVPCDTTITKTVDKKEACTNCGDLTYGLHVSYSGVDGQNVVVTDVLPAGAKFVSASDGGVESPVGSGIIVWNFGSVNNLWAKDLTLVVNPVSAGELKNTATSSVTVPGMTSSTTVTSNEIITTIIDCTKTPEFPTMIIPVASIIGVILITGYLKRKDQ